MRRLRKLADFAGTLPKGVERVAVEAELRSHEYQREVAVGDQRTYETGRSVPSASMSEGCGPQLPLSFFGWR